MVCYFLISGIHPFDSSHEFHPISMKIMGSERPIIDKIIPSPFDKLIEDCLVERTSFKNILYIIGSKEFITKIKFLDLEMFQKYQEKVVTKDFISDLEICSIRKREEFEIKENIGNGLFGNVTLCIDKTNKKKVVFKEISSEYKDFIEQKNRELLMINYPSIIPIYGFIEPTEEKKESVLLLPYIKNKDLYSFIKKSKKKLKYTDKCIIMYGIAFGMYKLHLHDIPHQDLKPSNIFLNDRLEPLISDFNLFNFVNSNQSILQSLLIGPNYYIAPEAFFNKTESEIKGYDEKKADVYSFGLLVYYLMTSLEPFESTNNLNELMERIKNNERPEIPNEYISKKMKDLISSCWNSNPNERPSFYEILEMISDPNFYTIKGSKFNTQTFYDYQVILGEPKFIKFDDESIYNFQHSGTNSMTDLRASSSSHLLSPEFIITEMADKEKNAEMQYRSGCIYRDGRGVCKDLSKAFKYFKKAADQNHIHGIIECSLCYKKGIGTDINEKEALKLIKIAIDKGSADALVILARWHLNSFPKRYKEAFQLLLKANEKNHPDSPSLIASLIEKNKIKLDEDNKFNKIELYKKSCNLGSYDGMFNMAINYHYGNNIDKNQMEAIRLYILVSKCNKSNRKKSLAIFLLAKLYEEIEEYQNAYNLADFHREKGKFIGYLICSDFLKRGIGCEKNDQISIEYEKIASEKRFVREQLMLAMFCHRCKEIENNQDLFLKWLEIAANNDSPVAQANLCRFYIKCQDKKNLAKDFGTKSANAGCHLGIWHLARFYKAEKNYEEEKNLLIKLAENGCKSALVRLGIILKRKKEFSEAFQKFKEAADRKSKRGIYHCGLELINGKLTSKNVDEGLRLLNDAADFGYIKAINKLIDIYKNGVDGVEKNLDMANQYQEKMKQMEAKNK